MECKHCERHIIWDDDEQAWADPEAYDDDIVWRYVCDEHDTFTAEHEPA